MLIIVILLEVPILAAVFLSQVSSPSPSSSFKIELIKRIKPPKKQRNEKDEY